MNFAIDLDMNHLIELSPKFTEKNNHICRLPNIKNYEPLLNQQFWAFQSWIFGDEVFNRVDSSIDFHQIGLAKKSSTSCFYFDHITLIQRACFDFNRKEATSNKPCV